MWNVWGTHGMWRSSPRKRVDAFVRSNRGLDAAFTMMMASSASILSTTGRDEEAASLLWNASEAAMSLEQPLDAIELFISVVRSTTCTAQV